MADAFHRINLLIQFHQAGMRSIHIRARSGPQAGFSAAFRAQRRILPHHSVHVGRRGAQVGNVPRETRQSGQLLHLFQDGSLAAALDELALMGGDRTEITSSEAAPVRDNRILGSCHRPESVSLCSADAAAS